MLKYFLLERFSMIEVMLITLFFSFLTNGKFFPALLTILAFIIAFIISARISAKVGIELLSAEQRNDVVNAYFKKKE